MHVPFLLTRAQMRRIRPHFPLSHGMPRVDDRRVVSGIIFAIQGGLRLRHASPGYGPPTDPLEQRPIGLTRSAGQPIGHKLL